MSRRRTTVLATVSILSLGCEPEGSVPSPQAVALRENPENLLNVQTVLEPDLTEETDWYTGATMMRWDPLTKILFVADAVNQTLVSMGVDGRLVTTFDIARGRGPGEIENIEDIALGPGFVAVLDRPLGRLLVYSRAGALDGSFSLPAAYHDFTVAGDSTLYMAPGTGGHAFDRFTLAGDQLPGIGRFDSLPEPCITNRCASERSHCIGCRLSVLNDSTLLVANLEEAILATFDRRTGGLLVTVDLKSRVPVLGDWVAEDQSLIEAANERHAARGERAVSFKSYLLSVHPVPGNGQSLIAAVAPSIVRFRETKRYELWIITLGDLTVRRLRFDRPYIGILAAGDGDVAFGVHSRSTAIFRADIPPSSN
ncbi:MAG: hypothetical protein ACRELV_09255 [Longimicrobiales bacterium]